ncbi:SdrD B-like domain-containing protein [Okeania sp. SIO2B3]|uniref:SdrD B-like domain-containing protein n=1 Tax=Okeania sp. SIO2B3 TaxID=2607784 RepID=UPI0013BED8AA|nr:SdrD B-like domain-containing protein [Okeania sp. SIO2B3]NET40466.1 hypothetical protein [Okeania sp. SIO2B3]
MSNIDNLKNILPEQVTVTAIQRNISEGGPQGQNLDIALGDPSYFDLKINDSTNLLDGSFDSYCLDFDAALTFVGYDYNGDGDTDDQDVNLPTFGVDADEVDPTDFSASVYSSYDTSIYDELTARGVQNPENLGMVNWLINNQDTFINQGFSAADIQTAVWELVDGTPNLSNDFRNYFTDMFGGISDANVAAIVAEAQNNADFVPQEGEKVAVILVPPDNNQIIIAGVELSSQFSASLGDKVFFDDDGDGIQDDGEDGVQGVTVTLTGGGEDGIIGQGNDDTTVTTTTDADGMYKFEDLNPGEEYKVTFSDLPEGFEFTDQDQGGDDAADSDADPSNGMTDVVILAPGEENLDVDAGIVATPTGSIGDTVFLDENGNGTPDAGEGIAGVEVKLDIDSDGTFDATETTDANGQYLFDGLNSGDYTVMVDTDTLPDDVVNTVDPDGVNDSMSDVTLGTGEDNLDQDFGYEEEPQNPGIEIEKSTNTVDADTPEEAPEIAAGEEVTWTYEVTNTGDVPFDESEVVVTDDIEGIITNIINKGDGDNILAPNETWIYEQTGIAQDLSTVTNNVIDFETDGEGNALAAGTIIDDEYQNLGVTISATEFGAMIFDSANPTGGDPDLATDSEGNILIISEDGDSSDPDDNAGGGVITFDLDNPIELNSINFVDIEETGGEVRTIDVDGNIIDTTSIPAPGNGSLQTLNINDSDVAKIEVELAGSGAISGLDFDSIGDGIYKNIGTVVADDVTDEDPSHYVNGEPDPQDPGIDIEKFTNGVDADTIEEAVEIAAGETVTWTYEVTNTGDVPFDISEIEVTDDQEGTITNISNQGDGDDTLDPNETWIYELTGTAQDLSTATGSQDITFNLTGSSSTTGNYGNVRTFTQDGVSVDVSAFSSNKSGGDWRTAYLGAYGGGLGVTNRNESGSHHRVDNGGSNDYILFEFDQNVTVDRALLDYIVDDSDISVWIGDRDGDISLLDGNILSGFTKENNDGGNGGSDYKRWANFNADELTGDTIVISARDDHSMDNFKLKKLDISVAGDTSIGNYVNIGTVTAGSVSDEDQSSYTNPDEPQNPGIDIEKFTNGVNADTLEEAAEIAAGETVTWTYEVTNTGDVPFDKSDIDVTDDQEGTITNIVSQGDGDNTLDPGETWTYEQTGTAQDLTTVTEGTTETFNFTGNSGLDGPNGNIRTFDAGDLSVNASAFSRDEHGNWDEGFLGSFSGGLGVTDNSEGDGSNNKHKVDNVYRDNYVLFEFSEDVVVDEALLASVTNDSDITYWVGSKEDAFTDHNILSDNFLDSLEFTEDNDTFSSSSRWANINDGEVSGNILVIAASTSDPTPEDRFKIKELEVQQVETVESGFYQNLGTVDINGLIDDDLSYYVNPDFSI